MVWPSATRIDGDPDGGAPRSPSQLIPPAAARLRRAATTPTVGGPARPRGGCHARRFHSPPAGPRRRAPGQRDGRAAGGGARLRQPVGHGAAPLAARAPVAVPGHPRRRAPRGLPARPRPAGDAHLRRGPHPPDRPGHQRAQHALLQPGGARPPPDHPGRPLRRAPARGPRAGLVQGRVRRHRRVVHQGPGPPGRRVPAGAQGHLDDRPGRVRGRVLPHPPLHHRDQARATAPSPHLPGPVDPCRPAAGGEIRRRLAPHRWAAAHAGDPADDGRAQASGPGGGPGPGRDGRDPACARHHHAAAAR